MTFSAYYWLDISPEKNRKGRLDRKNKENKINKYYIYMNEKEMNETYRMNNQWSDSMV